MTVKALAVSKTTLGLMVPLSAEVVRRMVDLSAASAVAYHMSTTARPIRLVQKDGVAIGY